MIASDPNPREITNLLIKAVRRAGCRAIIQSNWDELAELPEFPGIYRIISAPHHHIFPHCAAVIHHGGAGTTQAATQTWKAIAGSWMMMKKQLTARLPLTAQQQIKNFGRS